MYHKNPTYRIFYVFNVIFLIVISIACILPLVHIFAVSFSDKPAADANLVGLLPIGFTFESYQQTFENSNFLSALRISVLRALIGTVLGMVVTSLAAFSLSRTGKEFKARNVYVWFFLVIMIFDAGLVPHYIVMEKLNLINSFWIFVLPTMLNVWNIILMMNFFRSLPKDLDEAAIMDGASSFQILTRVYLPVSLPSIATLSLFTMVGHWNSWFDGMLYMTSAERWPLATLLQTIVVVQDFSKTGINPEDLATLSNRSVKAAQIFIAMVPILLVYPFLQRFFVKGIVLGAVKE